MWKIVLGFIVFSAVALFILKKSGGNIDMGGEKHEVVVEHPAAAASAASAASN